MASPCISKPNYVQISHLRLQCAPLSRHMYLLAESRYCAITPDLSLLSTDKAAHELDGRLLLH